MDRDMDAMAARWKAEAIAREEADAKKRLEQMAGRVIIPQELFRPNPKGYGVPLQSIPVGVHYQARFVSEAVPLALHFDAAGAHVCYPGTCKLCPGPALYAYAETLAFLPGPQGRPIVKLVILTIPDSGARTLFHERGLGAILEAGPAGLELFEGGDLRGHLIEFYRRNKRSKTEVAILEETCSHPLPLACDVRTVLMRQHRLSTWPDYKLAGVMEDGEMPDVIQFRKQA